MTEVASLDTYEKWYGTPPGNHLLSTLDNFVVDTNQPGHAQFMLAADKVLAHWQGDQFVGIMLSGSSGAGKTHAGVALARELHDRGAEVHFKLAPQLRTHIAPDSWSAPRKIEHSYDPTARTVTRSTNIPIRNPQRKGRPTAAIIEYQRLPKADTSAPETRVPINPSSVFPSMYEDGFIRNPKTVLLLDDVRPSSRQIARSAIEAAAHFGGMIIITSNFGGIHNFATPDKQDMVAQEPQRYMDETERIYAEQAYRTERDTLITAFMSRVVPNMVEVQFGGEDRRKEKAFWTDTLNPDDFN